MLAVIQFSDLHVAPRDYRGYGGLGPDTAETWAFAIDEAFSQALPLPDRVVITGDIANSGTAEEYEIAARRLARLPAPTNVLLGNHDREIAAQARLASDSVSMNRTERLGNWLFVYSDSNGTPIGDGGVQNRTDDPGRLTPSEIAWIDAVIEASDAEHVWLWMHHCPNAPGLFANPGFTDAVASVLARHARIRGVGVGHVHNNAEIELEGRPIMVCPSLTLNVDIHTWKTLPPGYREYTFRDNGEVISEVTWVDMPGFTPYQLPAAAIAHLNGELSWDQMAAEIEAARCRQETPPFGVRLETT